MISQQLQLTACSPSGSGRPAAAVPALPAPAWQLHGIVLQLLSGGSSAGWALVELGEIKLNGSFCPWCSGQEEINCCGNQHRGFPADVSRFLTGSRAPVLDLTGQRFVSLVAHKPSVSGWRSVWLGVRGQR